MGDGQGNSFFLSSLQESCGGGAARGKIPYLEAPWHRKKGAGSMMNACFLPASGFQPCEGEKPKADKGKK